MKADRCGTWTQQLMATIGYKTAGERKAAGCSPETTCGKCHHFLIQTFTNRDGGVGISLKCGHPKGGFATREKAGCNLFEKKK